MWHHQARRETGTELLEEGSLLRVLPILKQRTAATHQQVEAALDLLAPDVDAGRLHAVIGRFHAFWRSAEVAVDRWALTEPGLAARLEWPRRRRTGLLDADLARLGGPTPTEPVARPFEVVGAADALGWLYVSEGSTLGGALIARHIAPLRLESFHPYPEGPGPMWRRYGEIASQWVRVEPDRLEALCLAAERAFGALAAWVEPLRRQALG